MRIVLLGGSTPFVAPLFAELAGLGETSDSQGRRSLVLFGRSTTALAAVSAHARHVLPGWLVSTTTSLAEALDGAELVVHQIRYGDLEGRAADEQLAADLGTAADETLGPGALQAALRAAPGLRALAQELVRSCPGTFVVNLTNPLSVTTSLLARAGLRTIGLCELPEVTVQAASQLVGAPLSWAYTGLNHRGFLHHLAAPGVDVLARLGERLTDRSRLGVLGVEVTELEALPLKYFGLFADHAPHGAGRARVLQAMRATALDELAVDPAVSPPAIAGRSMPWWPESVGPALAAICGSQPRTTMVNLPEPDGLVRERRVELSGRDWRVLPSPEPPAAVTPWLERFEVHERAVLDALDDPTAERIEAACRADPLLPEASVAEAVRRLRPDAAGA